MSQDEKDLARCEKFRDNAFSSNPSVRFMFKHLKRGGCELSPDKVTCKKCDGKLAGGFQDDGGILLCSNHLTTQSHASNTLVHEAVHAFDACRAKVDWANCVHHACSEIRAAALSGDCDFSREVFLRRNIGFAKQFQRCVQRRAELSVSLNPYCDPLAVRFNIPHSSRSSLVLVNRKRASRSSVCDSVIHNSIGKRQPRNRGVPESNYGLFYSFWNACLSTYRTMQTKLAVKEAWSACFNDTAPFEKLP